MKWVGLEPSTTVEITIGYLTYEYATQAKLSTTVEITIGYLTSDEYYTHLYLQQ